jgi:hypothetical protein
LDRHCRLNLHGHDWHGDHLRLRLRRLLLLTRRLLLAWLLRLCGLLLSLVRGGGDIPAWCDWAGLRCRCGLLLTSRWLRHIRSES